MSKKASPENEVWYKDGLRFKCTECGKCCGGAPGYVWLSEADIERLSSYLQISQEELLRKHCRQIGNQFSLKEQTVNYNCIYLKDNKCSVYEARPSQCRTYPFWGKNLASKQAWNETQNECEGVNSPDSELICLETIRKRLEENH